MNSLQLLGLALLVSFISACKHPLEVIGNGDILSATGTRNCYLEDSLAGRRNCTENVIEGDYIETYYAVPRPGWKFDRWDTYCTDGTTGDECTFTIPNDWVVQFPNDTMPPLVAVFTPVVSTGGNPTTRDVEVNWAPPTARENGAYLPPNEISGYEVSYTAVTSGNTSVVSVSGGNTDRMEVDDLPADVYHFTVVAIDTENLKSRNPNVVQVDLR